MNILRYILVVLAALVYSYTCFANDTQTNKKDDIPSEVLEQLMLNLEKVNIEQGKPSKMPVSFYVKEIMKKVTSNWDNPEDTEGVCRFKLTLFSEGSLVSLDEIRHPQCQEAIRVSAIAAIYSSLPLPVSKNAEVFKEMREIILKFNPQESN